MNINCYSIGNAVSHLFKKTSLNNFKAFTYYELVKEPLHRDEAVSKLLAEVGHR